MGLRTLWDEVCYQYYGWILRNVNPLCPVVIDWVLKYAVYQRRRSASKRD